VFDLVLSPASPGGALSLDLGSTTVTLPALADGRRFALDLAGLTAEAAFESYLPLLVNDIGLGSRAATVSVNGVRAASVEINPEDGRAFNVIVQADETARTLDTLQVIPRLDLRVDLDHAALGDAAPAYDVTRVLLDGVVRTTEAADRMEVTAGSFSLTTDPASYGFVAPAGQCVTSAAVHGPDAPPFTQWTVGACE
jgi:hypothetical protein